MAYQAIACYCGGHLHAMDITCCAALGVPDTPVQQLQAIPPIPKEEAREDADAENISFHVYEYKTSLRKDGKERRRLELVQKHCKIGKFHRIHYLPALGRLRRIACGCELCKEQLGRPWVLPCIDVAAQPRYGQNKECTLWPSYEGGNDWKICCS